MQSILLTTLLSSNLFLFGESQMLFPHLLKNESGTFRNFRTTASNPFEGLDKLRASASSQPFVNDLQKIKRENAKVPITIIDLRRECHAFLNDYPLSWKLNSGNKSQDHNYNLHLTSNQIEEKETHFLNEILVKKISIFHTEKGVVELVPMQLATERHVAEQLGMHYIRLPILDHTYPNNEQVDFFVSLVKSLPTDRWLHIHCAGGQGRATTVMSMLDMMYNQHLSAETILQRQEKIGGSNLYDPNARYPGRPEMLAGAYEKLNFLKQFHRYCKEHPDFDIAWSAWINKQVVPD